MPSASGPARSGSAASRATPNSATRSAERTLPFRARVASAVSLACMARSKASTASLVSRFLEEQRPELILELRVCVGLRAQRECR